MTILKNKTSDHNRRKILLISDCPPNRHYSGSNLTVSLIKLIPDYDFAFYIIADKKLPYRDTLDKDLQKYSFKLRSKPNENKTSFLQYLRQKYFTLPKLTRNILRFAKSQKVDCIWSILQGQTMVCVTASLLKQNTIPVKVQIWDSLEWWLRARNIPNLLQRIYLNTFDQIILKANAIATASYNMDEEYQKKYKRNSNVFVSFLDKKDYHTLPQSTYSNTFLIGFCGQLYAKNNFLHLIDALNQLNWQVSDKKIILRMMTYIKDINSLKLYFDNIEMKDENVELPGWVQPEETIRLLKESDLLYCPYWFDQEFKLEAITSFPSKLTSYLVAERPILLHAPSYSSPHCFLKQYNAGLLCDALSSESIIATIKKLVNDPDLKDQLIINANKAFEENLTSTIMKKEVEEFLSIKPKII